MNPKFAIKVIRQGQTQKVNVVSPGAGQSGNALVIKATDASRYQISDVVTLTGPEKLNIKRVGADLHLALPGGDIDAPDVVIKDYFDVAGNVLQGQSISGEWMTYDTSGLSATSSSLSHLFGAADSASADAVTQTSVASLSSTGGLMGSTSTMWGLGALGLGLAAGGGSSGGGESSTSPIDTLKNYTNDTASTKTATKPTLSTYKELGIKAFTSLADTSEADRVELVDAKGVATTVLTADILNSALDKLSGSTLTKEKVQALADSYYRILKEADANTTTNTDVYNDTTNDAGNAALYNDPTATDYANVGSTVGSTTNSLSLLNDVVGRSAVAKVDTIDEINALARAAENVMLQAKAATAAATNGPALYTTDAEWISGLAALGITGVSAGMVADIKAKIAGTADDGTAVDTYQELADLLKPVVSAQILRNYSISSSNTAPTLADYDNAGVKAFNSLSDTTHGTSVGSGTASFLSASLLNSALDKLDLSSVTAEAAIKAKVQDMVDSYYRILREADGKFAEDGGTYTVANPADIDVYVGSPDDDPTASDYINIGITIADAINNGGSNETLDLLNDAIGRLTTTSVDTAGEVEMLATTANDVMLIAKNSNVSQSDTNLIAGLNNLLGLSTTSGVNVNNLSALKVALAATADDGTEVNTVDKLLGLVSMVRLKDFTDDSAAMGAKTAATPTLSDWSAMGVTANSSLNDGSDVALNQATYWKTNNAVNGLNALDSALDTYAGTAINQAMLQSIVDSYGRIMQEADGSWTTSTDVSLISNTSALQAADVVEQDLVNVGVNHAGTNGGSTAGTDSGLYYLSTGELLASVIGSLNSTSVDTVSELNTLAGYAEAVMKQSAGVTSTYSDGEWSTALNSLLSLNTTTGVNASNVARIKTAIDNANAAGVDTYDELQAIVSLVRVNDYAALTTGYTSPTIVDYQILTQQGTGNHTTTEVKSSYLSAYNNAMDARTGVASADVVEDMVVAYNQILDSADGNQTTTIASTSVADYSAMGVSVHGYTSAGGGTVVNTTTASTLNEVISGLSYGNVDTVSEVQALESIIGKIMAMAANAKTSGTATTVSDYTGLTQSDLGLLGLKGDGGALASASNVTGSELAKFNDLVIYSANDGTEVNTFAHLQALLNNAIVVA